MGKKRKRDSVVEHPHSRKNGLQKRFEIGSDKHSDGWLVPNPDGKESVSQWFVKVQNNFL